MLNCMLHSLSDLAVFLLLALVALFAHLGATSLVIHAVHAAGSLPASSASSSAAAVLPPLTAPSLLGPVIGAAAGTPLSSAREGGVSPKSAPSPRATTTSKPKKKGSSKSKLGNKDALDDIFEEYVEASEPHEVKKRPQARMVSESYPGSGEEIDETKSNHGASDAALRLPFHEAAEIELEDEENDEKLFKDMVSSLQQWQEHRARETRRRRGKK